MTRNYKVDGCMIQGISNSVGEEMHQLIAELYPICRSITGKGVRDTLHILTKHLPIKIHEVPSGTNVFDSD